MGLGISTEAGGGNFNDIVKFDARAGRFFRIDRQQGAGGNWEKNEVDITQGFQAVFDLASIEVGWINFATGGAPSFVLAPLGDPFPQRPSDQHKQGFRLMLKLGKASGGDAREFASCAKAVISAIDTLHDAYGAGKAANPGKLPLVAMTGCTPVKTTGQGQTSTNYSPNFEIVRWLDRPEGLDAPSEQAARKEPVQQQPARQAPQPVPAGADDNDF